MQLKAIYEKKLVILAEQPVASDKKKSFSYQQKSSISNLPEFAKALPLSDHFDISLNYVIGFGVFENYEMQVINVFSYMVTKATQKIQEPY